MPIVESDLILQDLGLPEAPRWAGGHLYLADASGGGVWRVRTGQDPVGPKEAVVEHRRGIAGLALHAGGGFVVGGRNLAWKNGDTSSVLATVEQAGLTSAMGRFNDLTVAADGAVYVGSIDFDPAAESLPQPGVLLRIGLHGDVAPVADAIAQSNGLGFSPDGRRLYHVDSGPRLLRGYDVGLDGSLGPWTVVHQWALGIPDGLAVAADGTVWVALGEADGRGFISVLDPDGSEIQRLEMPHPGVKSLCFGGPDGHELFVALGGDLMAERRDGHVIRIRVGVAGLSDTLARVEPPARVLGR